MKYKNTTLNQHFTNFYETLFLTLQHSKPLFKRLILQIGAERSMNLTNHHGISRYNKKSAQLITI